MWVTCAGGRAFGSVVAVAVLAGTGVAALSDLAYAACPDAVSGDYNGDGFADVAIGEPGAESSLQGWVHVLYGTGTGLTATAPADQVFDQDTAGVPDVGENEDRFGAALASGDFNGDCRADLVVGAPEEDSGQGAVTVLYGSDDGLDPATAEQFSQGAGGMPGVAYTGEWFGSALAAGDFNADGYADVAIGAYEDRIVSIADPLGEGAVYLLYGSANGLTTAGAEQFSQDSSGVPGVAEEDDRFGATLAAGDFDGDGGDDLAVGAYLENDGAGYAVVLYGLARAGLSSAGAQSWWQDSAGVADSAESGDFFGFALAAGDITGDGRDDLAVGVWGENDRVGAVQLLPGSGGGLTAAGSQLWSQDSVGVDGVGESDDFFGYAVALGDFTGDGHDDLAVGTAGENDRSGAVNVLLGTGAGLTANGDQLWTQNSAGMLGVAESGDSFGESLWAARISSSDHADLVVGIPDELVAEDNEGAVHVMPGAPAGLTATGDQIWSPSITGVAGDAHLNGFFGRALG